VSQSQEVFFSSFTILLVFPYWDAVGIGLKNLPDISRQFPTVEIGAEKHGGRTPMDGSANKSFEMKT
jgi:hypothetical protein